MLLVIGGSRSVFLAVFLMELISWVFALLVGRNAIKYLLVQSLFFVLTITGVLLLPMVILFGIMFKLGLPPFHLWFVSFNRLLNKKVFIMASTLHKLFPLAFMCKAAILGIGLLVGVLILTLRRLLLSSFRSLFHVLIFSSLVHSRWIFLRGVMVLGLLLVYWGLYTLTNILLVFGFFRKTLFRNERLQASRSSLLWLVLSGIPPFQFFWLKVIVVSLIVSWRVVWRVVIILSAVLGLVAYYHVFHLSLFPRAFQSRARLKYLGMVVIAVLI